MNDPIHYYVIIYDCMAREAAVQELSDYEGALIAYRNMRREKAELGRNDVEVILLGADCLETVEKLHSSHFAISRSISDVAAAFARPSNAEALARVAGDAA